MNLKQELELYPDFQITQMLFKDVKNAAQLRQRAVEGKFNGALISPTLVVSPFQVLVAVNKAVHLQNIGKMKTRSLYSEIIFNLSPTNNISEAFKRFGISDGDCSVLIVLVHKQNDTPSLSDIVSQVNGEQVPVQDLSSLSDATKVKKFFKISPQEEKIGTLLDAIVCRMSIKDVL
ncbi:unnamed protein product [Knipowitschia caucasica]